MGLEVYIIQGGGRNVLLKKYKTTNTEPDTKLNIYVCVKLIELYSKKHLDKCADKVEELIK